MLLWVHIDNVRVLLLDSGNKTTTGHSSVSSHGRLKALQKNILKTPRPPRNQKNLWQVPLLLARHSSAQLLLSPCLITITLFLQFCSLRSLCFSCIGCLFCTLAVVGPKGDSSVCRRWQEGKILCVPPALNNFVLVLSYHHKRQLLREVPYGRGTRNHPSSHEFTAQDFVGFVVFFCSFCFSKAYICISPYEAHWPLSLAHTV